MASIGTGFGMYSITKHAVIAFSETIREELKRYHGRKNILVSTLVPGHVDTNIMKTSSEILNEEKQWNVIKNTDQYKNELGKIIEKTRINVNIVADLVYKLGIQEKKCVIPTHFELYEAAVKDRFTALLNCETDKKSNMRKAVRKSMAESKL